MAHDHVDLSRKYKEFPPRWRNQSIPTSSRQAALASLATYTAIKPLGVMVLRLSWWAVATLGPIAIPSRSRSLELPIPKGVREDFLTLLRKEIGTFDELSIHRQRGENRSGFALLLLRDGSPRAFVKIKDAAKAERLRTEEQALAWIAKSRPTTFAAPSIIAAGEHFGWEYLALQPLPPRIHKTPKAPPIGAIAEEIGDALQQLPRLNSTPDHWKPMHGDFTPWNLRQVDNQLTLFDWEHVGWGPPGSDVALYQISSRGLGLATVDPIAVGRELLDFWVERGRIHPDERQLGPRGEISDGR